MHPVIFLTSLLCLGFEGEGTGPMQPHDSPDAAARAKGPDAGGEYCMMGRVLIEGTGEPVRGAVAKVAIGAKSGPSSVHQFQTAESDGDGNYVVALPLGTARAWPLQPPPGYWTSSSIAPRSFSVSPSRRVQRQDYTVRRGTAWTFRLTRGGAQAPIGGGRVFHNLVPGEAPSLVNVISDQAGYARATFPGEAGRATILVQPGDLPGSAELVSLDWESGFRPDAVKGVGRAARDGPIARFRLTDPSGRSATISGPVEPLVVDGGLVLRIVLAEPDVGASGILSGRVVDEKMNPIEGAAVALIIREGQTTDVDPHIMYTDFRGNFVFPRVSRRGAEGELKFGVVARKPGYSPGTTSESVELAANDSPRVIELVQLSPGVVIGGTVVDHEGQAVEGAWVEIQDIPNGQIVKTDFRGRFTIRDVTRGVIPVVVQADGLIQQQRFVADGGPDPLTVRLPRPGVAGPKPGASPTPAPLGPAKLGRPAPPWQLTGWTDGENRALADYRGKVVLLDFWGIWCGPCVRELPSLERLRGKYEAKGVVFLGVHSPGEDVEQVRKFLVVKGITFPSGIDAGDLNTYGTTVERYGVTGFPTIVLVDRQGLIAFSSHNPSYLDKYEAILTEHRLNPEKITLEQRVQMNELLLDREIERLVDRR